MLDPTNMLPPPPPPVPLPGVIIALKIFGDAGYDYVENMKGICDPTRQKVSCWGNGNKL